ncbi:MAG: S-layer homology domain-containing protein [Clostridia bacterium]|nr:S-layer homology domain-containing protein [Clostridia bacterium]
MKRLLSITLAICMIFGLATAANASESVYEHEPVNPFADVAEDAWYHDEVVDAASTGIINGKTQTEFKPEDLLTYAEAIKLAACMNQVHKDGKVTLSNGNPWYAPYVEYCKENKIIGVEYNYSENATRAGYMEIFANALPDEAFADINNIRDGSILDVKDNSPYAIYVYKLYRAGIVTGVDEKHNCNPDANIRRCEVATIISRMMNAEKRVKFDMPNSSDITISDGDVDIVEKPAVEVNTEPSGEVIAGTDVEISGHESIVVTPGTDNQIVVEDGPTTEGTQMGDTTVVVVPKVDYDVNNPPLIIDDTKTPVEIIKHPESIEVDGYMSSGTLTVEAVGGSGRYTYQWKYRSGRETFDAVDSFNVKGSQTNEITISANPNDPYTGAALYCTVTDANGTSANSHSASVFGPFSMKIESRTIEGEKLYLVTGRIADGLLKAGDLLSVERIDKVIAFGTVEKIEMFGKSLDVAQKGDNVGIYIKITEGYTPAVGDVLIRWKDFHVVDGSDIVN